MFARENIDALPIARLEWNYHGYLSYKAAMLSVVHWHIHRYLTESGQPIIWGRTKKGLSAWFVMCFQIPTPECRLPIKKRIGSREVGPTIVGLVGNSWSRPTTREGSGCTVRAFHARVRTVRQRVGLTGV